METFEDRGTRRRAARARRKAAARPKSTRGARALAFVASLGLMSPAPLEAMHSRGTLGIPSIIRVGGSLLYDRSHNTTITSTTVDDSDPVMTLDALTYTCVITNTGGAPLTGLSLAFTIDTHSTYVSASAGTFTSISQSGGVVTATLSSSLAAGGTATCTITVTTPATAQTLTATSSATATNATTQNDSETTDVQLVAKDGTSGIRCPASSAQWTSVRACKGVLGTPSILWLCQEASGNLADSIGTFTATQQSTAPTYQSTETGWSRKGLRFTEAQVGDFFNLDSGLPNPATTSGFILAYVILDGSPGAGDRVIFEFGNSGGGVGMVMVRKASSFVLETHMASAAGADTGTNRGGQVRPLGIQSDVTAPKGIGYTDIDKLVPTVASLSFKIVRLGSPGFMASSSYLYWTFFAGVNAEFTTAQFKATEQALGWSPTWSP